MAPKHAIRSQAKAGKTSFPVKKLLLLAFYALPLVVFLARGAEPAMLEVQSRPSDEKAPIRVIIHRFRRNAAMALRLPSFQAVTSGGTFRSTSEVEAYVHAQARKYGVNPDLAVWIVEHESQFNPRAKGDGEASRGLWQISKIYHPEVPDAVAFNVKSSTEWSLERIAAGKVNEWSTYRFCKSLYSNCPF